MDNGLDGSVSQGNQYPVYVGIWTNWSRGRIMGSTLTISRRDADLLIAFTAFFIAFVATRTWRILCFIFHQFYSTADPQDAIHHQRQAIFRNSSSPESGIQILLRLLWANRHSKGWFRPLPAAIVAIVCISAFTIAGGFSSQISTAVGDEVLISSSNCGYTPLLNTVSEDPFHFLRLSDLATKTNSAANYAQQCYSNENTGLLECGRFTTKKVANNKMDNQAGCPFKEHLCRNESTNLYIDSGYIDSHKVFGINAPLNERVLFREVLHCAPLTTTGFTYEKNTSLGRSTLYQYGFTIGGGENNYVHAAQSVESQYLAAKADDVVADGQNYILTPYASVVKNQTTDTSVSEFYPIDEIARKDADITLLFLSGNGVTFSQPSDDQWYRLNSTPSSFIIIGNQGEKLQLYIPQEPASPLSCISQYQFCNTAFEGTQGCGPLASLKDGIAGAAPFFDTTYTEFSEDIVKSEAGAQFNYVINTLFSTSTSQFFGILQQLGSTSLTSQKTLRGGFQGPIASNQWQSDVSHWWDISMAALQSGFLDSAYVPDNSNILVSRFNYTAPEFQKLCSNQKIRSTSYGSFSLFGLFFTLTVGLLLILVSYLLEPMFESLHKRKGYKQYAYLEWVAGATLQLQRLAHEEIGFGTWSEGTETIPMAKEGELLGSLDITDPRHPILRRPMNSISFADEGSAETLDTAIGDGPEHMDTLLQPPNYASDMEQEIHGNFQEDLAGEETQIGEHQPTINPSTVSPCENTPLDHAAELDHYEHPPITHNATEPPVAISVGTQARS
ncbi:hypothetical protein GGR58DRAFT_503168 [Xylaria digitata]|nr:hypothetical protein GGR58DRAFT_503168 [Xylaria digitata]